MKSFILLVLAFAVAFAFEEQEYQDSFLGWMRENSKFYDHEEFRFKYQVFKQNMDFVHTHNADPTKHRVALNKFADMTAQEFASIFNGMNVNANLIGTEDAMPVEEIELPASKDWRQSGAVTAIKNQGQCGSCWSFSTTGSVEGCHKLSGHNLVALSEKNLMDCSWNEGNMGCNGGLMTAAMKYIVSNGGVDTEASYPYSPESSHDCRFSKANVGSTLGSYKNVQRGSETGLQESANIGPTSVAIDASHSSFQLYHSGVYYEPDCSQYQLDHGVLVIGWGTDAGQDFWLVKNSWGTDWGMEGYIEMSRNRNNNCGIASMATLPSTCN